MFNSIPGDDYRVILVGAGSMIVGRLKDRLKCQTLTSSSRKKSADFFLDLKSIKEDDIKFINEKDIIIIAAGISSPDLCEREYENAKSINLTGTHRLINYCLERGSKVIFFSSDSVYGNTAKNQPALENMILSPIGNYAEMKAEIEYNFHDRQDFLALRLSYVLSHNDKFTKYLRYCSSDNKKAEIFHPLYRNAVWIEDLLTLITSVINKWPSMNIINVGGPNLVSRLDIANAFKKSSGFKFDHFIVQPEESFYQARPREITLNIDIFTQHLGRIPHNIKTAYEKEFKI